MSLVFRCEAKADDELPSSTTTHQSRSYLKNSSLMNSSTNLTSTQQHQQLLAQLLRIENQKKIHTLTSLLQTPIQSRSLSTDPNDPLQQKVKRFKSSHKKSNSVRILNSLLISIEYYFLLIPD